MWFGSCKKPWDCTLRLRPLQRDSPRTAAESGKQLLVLFTALLRFPKLSSFCPIQKAPSSPPEGSNERYIYTYIHTYVHQHPIYLVLLGWYATLTRRCSPLVQSTTRATGQKQPYGLETVPYFAGSHVKFIGKRSALSCALPKYKVFP